jgi:cytoskeletal protein RodZ
MDEQLTLGQQFKQAREVKGVSLSEAAEKTKILTRLLEDLETDNFERMAAPTYAKGFIKIYAEYLGLDPEPLINEYYLKHAPQKQRLAPADPAPSRLPAPPWEKLFPFRFNAEGLQHKLKLPGRPLWIAVAAAGLLILLLILFSLVGRCQSRAEGKPPPPDQLAEEPQAVYMTAPGRVVPEQELLDKETP